MRGEGSLRARDCGDELHALRVGQCDRDGVGHVVLGDRLGQLEQVHEHPLDTTFVRVAASRD